MNGLIYLIGLVVVILFILSFFGSAERLSRKDNSRGGLRAYRNCGCRNCDVVPAVDPRRRRRTRSLGYLIGPDRVWFGDRPLDPLFVPTWRDASPALAVLSGLFLLLTAVASFGLGGYVAGRLRERWHQSAHNDVVEFRDGTHGVVAWALAVVITGLVVAASATAIASRGVQPATSPVATTGEPLIAYELDRLFRAGQRPFEGDLTYTRAEAGRSCLRQPGGAELRRTTEPT